MPTSLTEIFYNNITDKKHYDFGSRAYVPLFLPNQVDVMDR